MIIDFHIKEYLRINIIVGNKIRIIIIVATLILGSRLKQGLARLRAKREARGSHLMFLGVQKSVRE
jgi:hypothetical protein